jgi:ABC-type dipeptide/oligopeptide/nickel transport systems, permease components
VLYGEYTLIVRSAMLETLGEDYILTARAKGLKPRTIVRKHALRNAMLPITTLIALSLGYIVAGAILIETVFSWPGIGRAVYEAVLQRDYPMLQGAFLVLTVSVIFCNLVADLLYFRLDPRITDERGVVLRRGAGEAGTSSRASCSGRSATSALRWARLCSSSP